MHRRAAGTPTEVVGQGEVCHLFDYAPRELLPTARIKVTSRRCLITDARKESLRLGEQTPFGWGFSGAVRTSLLSWILVNGWRIGRIPIPAHLSELRSTDGTRRVDTEFC